MYKLNFVSRLCCLLSLLALCLSSHAKVVYGRVETVNLSPEQINLAAKMDTGAFRSSLQAQEIEFFKKDKKRWVRFKLKHGTLNQTIERPFVTTTKIKRRIQDNQDDDEDDKKLTKRPVVLLDLCIGEHHMTIEASLTDRSNFKYPLLIGRKAMEKYQMVIDPSLTRTVSVQCTTKKNNK